MTRQFYPGGWYCDAAPDGRRCVAFRGQQNVETHEGAVSTAPRDLLFVRCPSVGPFRFAGQEGDRPNHQGDGNYEYPGGARVGDSISVSPVIYDLNGELQQAKTSHQGYRYVAVDGTLITGDQTYNPNTDFARALGVQGIAEWSSYGGLYIGQGYEGGCLVWDGVALRQLEGGDCRFIRVQGVGDKVAISIVKPDGAVIFQTTLAELFALPLYIPPTPAPAPPPPPAPKPEPTPVSYELPQLVESLIDRFVAQYPIPQMAGPGPSDDAFENLCRSWIYMLAQTVSALVDASWGVKNAGGGRPQSKDSLSHLDGGKLINFDLLSGVGTGKPALVHNASGEDITGQSFMAVPPVNWLSSTPAPPPTPAPAPTPQPSADLERRLAAVEAALVAIEAANAAERDAVAALAAALQALREKPAPTYRVVGGTGRTFGHSHTVNVTLEPQG